MRSTAKGQGHRGQPLPVSRKPAHVEMTQASYVKGLKIQQYRILDRLIESFNKTFQIGIKIKNTTGNQLTNFIDQQIMLNELVKQNVQAIYHCDTQYQEFIKMMVNQWHLADQAVAIHSLVHNTPLPQALEKRAPNLYIKGQAAKMTKEIDQVMIKKYNIQLILFLLYDKYMGRIINLASYYGIKKIPFAQMIDYLRKVFVKSAMYHLSQIERDPNHVYRFDTKVNVIIDTFEDSGIADRTYFTRLNLPKAKKAMYKEAIRIHNIAVLETLSLKNINGKNVNTNQQNNSSNNSSNIDYKYNNRSNNNNRDASDVEVNTAAFANNDKKTDEKIKKENKNENENENENENYWDFPIRHTGLHYIHPVWFDVWKSLTNNREEVLSSEIAQMHETLECHVLVKPNDKKINKYEIIARTEINFYNQYVHALIGSQHCPHLAHAYKCLKKKGKVLSMDKLFAKMECDYSFYLKQYSGDSHEFEQKPQIHCLLRDPSVMILFLNGKKKVDPP